VRTESRTVSALERVHDENRFDVEDACPLKFKENCALLEPPNKFRCTHWFFSAISAGEFVTAHFPDNALVAAAQKRAQIIPVRETNCRGAMFIELMTMIESKLPPSIAYLPGESVLF